MIFHSLSIAFISKSFFSALLALCAALLMLALSGCISSPGSQHIDYVISQKPLPQPMLQLQPTPPVLVLQHIQPEQQSQPLLQTLSSYGDATCTSASHLQSDMLNRVNRIRAAGAVCGDVRYPATGPLRWNSKLQQAAAAHSHDMADHNFLTTKAPPMAPRCPSVCAAWATGIKLLVKTLALVPPPSRRLWTCGLPAPATA